MNRAFLSADFETLIKNKEKQTNIFLSYLESSGFDLKSETWRLLVLHFVPHCLMTESQKRH